IDQLKTFFQRMQQILLLAGHVVDPVNKKVVAAENIPRTRGIGERLVKIVVHVPKEIDLASEFLEQARDSFQVFLAVHPRFLCYRTVQTFGSDAGVPEIRSEEHTSELQSLAY